MGPARRHPGPALPARDRHDPRPRSSTPSWPDGWPGSPGSAWARWSRTSSATPWRRATPRSTGRPARCPSPGCATPRSTSSSWSTCGTRWRRSWTGRASWSGPCEEFDAIAVGAAAAAPQGPLAAHLRHAQGAPAPADRRRTGAVGRPGTGSRSAGTSRRARCSADAAIVEAALAVPANVHALAALPGFGHRMGRRQLEQWQAAVDRAKELPESELPQPGQRRDRARRRRAPGPTRTRWPRPGCPRPGPPSPRWPSSCNMPQENLITPDTVRRVCWEPPTPLDAGRGRAALAGYGARGWQVEQVDPAAGRALAAERREPPSRTATPRPAGARPPIFGRRQGACREPSRPTVLGPSRVADSRQVDARRPGASRRACVTGGTCRSV